MASGDLPSSSQGTAMTEQEDQIWLQALRSLMGGDTHTLFQLTLWAFGQRAPGGEMFLAETLWALGWPWSFLSLFLGIQVLQKHQKMQETKSQLSPA